MCWEEDFSYSNCEMCGEVNAPTAEWAGRLRYCCRACGWWWSSARIERDEEPTPAQPRDYLLPRI